MRRALIATRLFGVPLLAERSYVDVFATALADDLGIEPLAEQAALEAQRRPTRYPAIYQDQGGVAVVPVVGALVHRAGPSATMSAMQGYAGTQNLLMELAEDPSVRGILLDLDTPGGEVGGVAELGDTISEIAKVKPVWALANPLAASAGYWIASSVGPNGKILAAPFARIGSVGVVTMHMDMSKAAEKRGVAMTYIHAGKYKVAGHPFAALDEETRSRMQTMIDSTYDAFVAHVAINRGMKEEDVRATEAMVYTAQEALELKLVDGISTLGQAITSMRDHLATRGRAVNIQGTAAMADEAQITAARDAGRTEGANAERERITGILGHESAKGREKLAMTLAATPSITSEQAVAILGAAAKETVEAPKKDEAAVAAEAAAAAAAKTNSATDSILSHLRATSPAVTGEEGANEQTRREDRRKEMAGTLGHLKKTA